MLQYFSESVRARSGPELDGGEVHEDVGAGRGTRPQRHQDGKLRRGGEELRRGPGAKQEWRYMR